MSIRPIGDWKVFAEVTSIKNGHSYGARAVRESQLATAKALVEALEYVISQGLASGPSLSQMTKDRKVGTSKLYDTGDLAEAFKIARVGTGASRVYYVGIPEEAVGQRGLGGSPRPLHEIATVMQYGATFNVTDKMRKFFLAVGYPLRRDTNTIKIPARPYRSKAVTIVNASTKARVKRAVAKSFSNLRILRTR